jgi:signal transduction histidine kinase
MSSSSSLSSLEELSSLMDDVSRAASLDVVYLRALDGLERALGIERAAILVLDSYGSMRFVAASGISEGYQRAVEGHSPWSPDQRDADPVLVEDVNRASDLAPYGELFRSEGIGALAFIPVQYAGRLLGKFMLYHAEPHRFTADEIAVSRAIAAHIAFAIERFRIERAHARLYQEAREAVRARDETVAVVSHDLRDPLGTICTGCAVLEMDPEAALAANTPAAMLRAAKQMERLVQDLLDVTRIEAGGLSVDLGSVEVAALLRETAALFESASVEKSVRLEVAVASGLPRVRADRGRLSQVLSNLVGNAIKFVDGGGWVQLAAAGDGAGVRLSVRDDGPGVAPEQLPRLFDRFWQAEREQRGGAGLGLAIAKGIVEAHGSSISVASELGSGTTFSFALPAADTEPGSSGERTSGLLESAAC